MKIFINFKYALIMSSLLISGCSSIISAIHEEPIHQRPGHVSLGTSINDSTLEVIANVNIGKASKALEKSHIFTVVYDGDILLLGEVPSQEDKKKAEEVVEKILGIKKIYNELHVGPRINLISRTSDAWISSKIKMKMLTKSKFPSSEVKVVTEHGIVYLLGKVKHSVSDEASDIARDTTGVQKVVKLFNYLD